MEEKPNYYAIIPADVRYDNELRPNEKLLFGEISALANKTGVCFANNNYFSELYGVQPNAIATWIKHLKAKDYIKVEYEYKSGTKEIAKRHITLGGIQKDTTSYSKEYRGGIQKDSTGGIQKGEDNNTSNINNTSINNKEINKERYLDIQSVVDYLNLTLHTKYRYTSAFVKHINARFEEGYTVDDFLDVIENKYAEWHGTDMEKYLRPDTLFGTKFEIYLNQKK